MGRLLSCRRSCTKGRRRRRSPCSRFGAEPACQLLLRVLCAVPALADELLPELRCSLGEAFPVVSGSELAMLWRAGDKERGRARQGEGEGERVRGAQGSGAAQEATLGPTIVAETVLRMFNFC